MFVPVGIAAYNCIESLLSSEARVTELFIK